MKNGDRVLTQVKPYLRMIIIGSDLFKSMLIIELLITFAHNGQEVGRTVWINLLESKSSSYHGEMYDTRKLVFDIYFPMVT